VPGRIRVSASAAYLLKLATEPPMQKPRDFNCPHCGTAYQMVQVQSDSYTDAEIDCLVCGKPLEPGDGNSFFKYFLVDSSWLSRQQLLALHHDAFHHDDVCKLRGARQ
jgi:endogenous inhibitor of DNA gyrase (YacG/DUF329 family)